MLDYFAGSNVWDALKVTAILTPVLIFVWIVMTVMALHRREVYFWSLGSTWTSLIACPLALVIMSFSVWRQAHDPNAPFDLGIIFAGAILYATALAFAMFYNFRETRSGLLALSTTMMQQFCRIGFDFVVCEMEWRASTAPVRRCDRPPRTRPQCEGAKERVPWKRRPRLSARRVTALAFRREVGLPSPESGFTLRHASGARAKAKSRWLVRRLRTVLDRARCKELRDCNPADLKCADRKACRSDGATRSATGFAN